MCREVLEAPHHCCKQSSSCISPLSDAETQGLVFHFMDHGSRSSVFYLLPGASGRTMKTLAADGDGTVPPLLPLPQVPDTVSPGLAPVLRDLLLPAVLAEAAEQPPTTHSGRLCAQQLGYFLCK
ncbi:transmembrane protein 207 isoform X2 [Gallus gallus]|uniref:transmembrane protein 207 isoform X2 n=1 Tax=Gallus gallus TaxID=9031 RepID=UPI001F00B337|nr:transmembrane protein 207 isoform X2 [Gallus gallus]